MRLDFSRLDAIASPIRQEDHRWTLTEYRTDIKRSEKLKADILKMMEAGEPVHNLFLKAVEYISDTTGDKRYYSCIKHDLEGIYGAVFGDEIPLEWELDGLERRLEKLREAYKRKTTSSEIKCRIEAVIREHEIQVAMLKGSLEKAKRKEQKWSDACNLFTSSKSFKSP